MEFNEFVLLVESLGGTVVGEPMVWKSVKVELKSKNSSFYFGERVKVESLSLTDYGGDNTYKVSDNSKFTGVIKSGSHCKLSIGKNFSSTGGLKLHLSEHSDIIIGDNCMFGVEVNIYNHDYHPIFEMESGERLNYSKTVIIENNVWLANKSTILKGVTIGSGSVVGLGSTVTNNIDSNCIAVGTPAKIIKRGIIWDRASLNTTHKNGINNIKEVKK